MILDKERCLSGVYGEALANNIRAETHGFAIALSSN